MKNNPLDDLNSDERADAIKELGAVAHVMGGYLQARARQRSNGGR